MDFLNIISLDRVLKYVALAVKIGVKSHPFKVTGVCKSIATLSVYNEALVVLLFIVMGTMNIFTANHTCVMVLINYHHLYCILALLYLSLGWNKCVTFLSSFCLVE